MKNHTAIGLLLILGCFVSSCNTTPSSKTWQRVSQRIGPVEYIPIMQVCELLSMNYEWDALTKKHILHKDGSFLSFKTEDRTVSIDGNPMILAAPPRLVNGNLMLPRELVELQWWRKDRREELWKEVKTLYPGAPFVINRVVVDPGHGGKDRGTFLPNGVEEKRLVLEISQKLKQKLEGLGLEVVMTRNEDRYLTLPERCWVANKSGADLFVSIHVNSAPDPDAEGTEIYYVTEDTDDTDRASQMVRDYGNRWEINPDLPNKKSMDPTLWDIINTENRREAKELARNINASFKRFPSIRNRGIKSAEFFVTKWTDKPSLLIETGFLTNPREGRLLQNATYQDQLAGLIAEGIMAYKADYERTRGFTLK